MRARVTSRELPGWVSGLLVAATFGTLLYLERCCPLRRRKHEGKLRRDARNLAMAGLSAATISALEKPVVGPLSRWVVARRFGLLQRRRLPAALEVALGVVLLDYTLYVWHVLTHKVKLLWRFHEVHHADLDMDQTTALRFHWAEMALSVPWRAAQVALIGASPLALTSWQTLTTMAILFHHSNVELPHGLERRLARLIVTPRVHGIHHSIVRRETDSNWSTIFTWPDAVHGTARWNVPQDEVVVGVPAHRDPRRLRFPDLVVMPFRRRERSSRELPDGSRPERHEVPRLSRRELAR